MQIAYPQYLTNDKLNVAKPIGSKLLSSIRIYLLKQIAFNPSLSPVRANIKSPLITNTRHFGRLKSSEKNKLTPLHTSKKIRKGSDSSSSSASASAYKELIPTKIDVFDKKQQRWAIKNGIAVHSKKVDSPQVKNKIQIHAVHYLRDLSNAIRNPLALSSPSKLPPRPQNVNKSVIKQINDNLTQLLNECSPDKNLLGVQ